MKYIKYFMALITVCVLVIPAFSVQDNGSTAYGQKEETSGRWDTDSLPGRRCGCAG